MTTPDRVDSCVLSRVGAGFNPMANLARKLESRDKQGQAASTLDVPNKPAKACCVMAPLPVKS